MPELPEVETMRRDLNRKIKGLQIKNVQVYDQRVLKDITPRRFIQKLVSKRFVAVDRRGKGIILTLDDGTFLFVQVKMTGHFVYGPNLRQNTESNEAKVIFQLSNGQFLNYNDQRLFGWLYLIERLEEVPYLNTIGPEPLGPNFSVEWLSEQLKKRISPIKPLLMNQHFIAGIGNIYASEILYAAGVHPEKSAQQLTRKQVAAIHQSAVAILKESIRLRGTSMRNYRDSDGKKGAFMSRIKVYGKVDEQCPTCKQPIQRIVQAQRSTFFCKKCQV